MLNESLQYRFTPRNDKEAAAYEHLNKDTRLTAEQKQDIIQSWLAQRARADMLYHSTLDKRRYSKQEAPALTVSVEPKTVDFKRTDECIRQLRAAQNNTENKLNEHIAFSRRKKGVY